MSMYMITFSPTGGTNKVAEALAHSLFADYQTIDLADSKLDFSSYSFTADDVCLIAAPVFGGRIPKTAAERLAQMQAQNTRAVLAAVYGNRAFEDALVEMQDIAERIGMVPIAGVAAIAEHSIARTIAAARPNDADMQQLKQFAQMIAPKLHEPLPSQKLQLPGNHPYRDYSKSALVPSVKDTCSKCGICAAHCPVNAISADDPTQTDASKCIACMRCIAVCPDHERFLPAPVLDAMTAKLSFLCPEPKQNECFL